MTIKRNGNRVALFILGLLCMSINSFRVMAMQQGVQVGTVVGEAARNTGTFVGTAARGAGDFVGTSAEGVGEFVGTAAERVGQTIDRGIETAGRVVEGGVQAVGQGVQTAGRVVQQGAQTAGRVVQQGQQIAGTVARQGVQIVGGAVQQGVETAGTVVRQGVQSVGGGVGQGMQTAGAIAGQAVKVGGAVVGQGVQTIGSGVATGANVAAQGVQTVGRVVQQGMQTAGDVASRGVQTGAAIGRGAMQVEGAIAKTGLDVAQKGIQTVGSVTGQAIQTGTELSKEQLRLRGTLERGAVDLAGTAVGTGIGIAGDVAKGGVGIAGTAINQGVETGAHVIGTVGKGLVQTKEQIQDVTTEAAQSAARTGSIIGTSAQKTGEQLSEAFGGVPEIADTAVSGVTEGFQNAFLGIFGKTAAGFPPVLKKKNVVVNIVSPIGPVYLNDAKTLCVGKVSLRDPRAQFIIAREQAPYFWFRSVKFPKEMIRHIPRGAGNVGGAEGSLISKVPDFGWETGGAWERVYVVDGKYIMTTRWDGSITEPGGFLRTNDGVTLTSKNASGNDYAFKKEEALTFIFVEAGSKDAESMDLELERRPEQKPQLQPSQRDEGPKPLVIPQVPTAVSIDQKAELWSDIGSDFMTLGGAQVIAHPLMSPFNKFVFKSVWYSSDTIATFAVKAAAKQDVVIALASEMNQTSGNAVRLFTIGAYNNTTIIARPDAGGPVIKPAEGMTILDGEDKYTQFWISYDKSTGMATIGKGNVVGANVLVSWKDPSPLKTEKIYLGVGAWFDSKMGSKVFYNNISVIPSVDSQPARKEEVVTKTGIGTKTSTTTKKIVQSSGKKRTQTSKTIRGAKVKSVTPEVKTDTASLDVTESTETTGADATGTPNAKKQIKRKTRASSKTQVGTKKKATTSRTRGTRETTDKTKPLVDRM